MLRKSNTGPEGDRCDVCSNMLWKCCLLAGPRGRVETDSESTSPGHCSKISNALVPVADHLTTRAQVAGDAEENRGSDAHAWTVYHIKGRTCLPMCARDSAGTLSQLQGKNHARPSQGDMIRYLRLCP